MLDHTQASGQGKQSPNLGGQLYCILHTHQIYHLQTIISLGPVKEGLKSKYYSSDEGVKEQTT